MILCSIDWFKVFQILMPLMIAIGVYLAWHWQKGKEVIAIEAKNLIIKINDLNEFEKWVIVYFLTKDKKDLCCENFDKLNELNNDVIKNLHFLSDALESMDFTKEVMSYQASAMETLDIYREYAPKYDFLNDGDHILLSDTHNKFINSIHEMKKVLFEYALYKKRVLVI